MATTFIEIPGGMVQAIDDNGNPVGPPQPRGMVPDQFVKKMPQTPTQVGPPASGNSTTVDFAANGGVPPVVTPLGQPDIPEQAVAGADAANAAGAQQAGDILNAGRNITNPIPPPQLAQTALAINPMLAVAAQQDAPNAQGAAAATSGKGGGGGRSTNSLASDMANYQAQVNQQRESQQKLSTIEGNVAGLKQTALKLAQGKLEQLSSDQQALNKKHDEDSNNILAETQRYMDEKTDPVRVFHNMSTLGQIASFTGLFLSGLVSNRYRMENTAAKVITDLIDNDMKAQAMDHQKRGKGLELKNSIMNDQFNRGQSAINALMTNTLTAYKMAAENAELEGQKLGAPEKGKMLGAAITQVGVEKLMDIKLKKQAADTAGYSASLHHESNLISQAHNLAEEGIAKFRADTERMGLGLKAGKSGNPLEGTGYTIKDINEHAVSFHNNLTGKNEITGYIPKAKNPEKISEVVQADKEVARKTAELIRDYGDDMSVFALKPMSDIGKTERGQAFMTKFKDLANSARLAWQMGKQGIAGEFGLVGQEMGDPEKLWGVVGNNPAAHIKQMYLSAIQNGSELIKDNNDPLMWELAGKPKLFNPFAAEENLINSARLLNQPIENMMGGRVPDKNKPRIDYGPVIDQGILQMRKIF